MTDPIRVHLTAAEHEDGVSGFCSWERLAATGHQSLFGTRKGERIVAINVDERGITAVFEVEDGK
jgi:hypothetical protein